MLIISAMILLVTRQTNNAHQKVRIIVSVEDTGIGIPEQAQKRVFTPFMQADSSTSRNYGGTGIGLSISKGLVELMGGQMTFTSCLDIGSTFSFSVELQRCEKSSALDQKISLSDNLPTSFQELKAIVVDGKPVRAAVTRYHLKRLGIEVEVVSSIKTAADVFANRGSLSSKLPDMLLVEKDSWISSEENGAVTSLNRGHNGHSYKVPVMILLASNISVVETDKAKASGYAETVIMKPLRASMVAACLQQVLGATGQKIFQGRELFNSWGGGLLCGKKILVVDDNVVNRRVAAGALKKFGADVQCAESGQEALDWLQIPHVFDACFMDIQMPEMDGFEATRRIRDMERDANMLLIRGYKSEGKRQWHVPILAMTADVIHATLEKCLKCGMDGYVSKPFQENTLYQAVATFFQSTLSRD